MDRCGKFTSEFFSRANRAAVRELHKNLRDCFRFLPQGGTETHESSIDIAISARRDSYFGAPGFRP